MRTCRRSIFRLSTRSLFGERFPFENKRTLVVGDGDLSFSLALVKQLSKQSLSNTALVTATTFDSLNTLQQKYKHVNTTIEELQQHNFVQVFHSVDATDLQGTLTEQKHPYKYDYIVWNFPHPGSKNFMKKNRLLMQKFFASAAEIIQKDISSRIFVTLVCAQGGTDFEIIHVPEEIQKKTKKPWKRNYGDHWQIVEQSAKSNFYLSEIQFFHPPEGYKSRGYRDNVITAAKGFRTDYSVTHSFSPDISVGDELIRERKQNYFSSFSEYFSKLLFQTTDEFVEQEQSPVTGCSCNIMNETIEEPNESLVSCSISNHFRYRQVSLPFSPPSKIPWKFQEINLVMNNQFEFSGIQKFLAILFHQLFDFESEDFSIEAEEPEKSGRYYVKCKRELCTIEHKAGACEEYYLGCIRKNDHGNWIWESSLEELIMVALNINDVRWFAAENILVHEQIGNLIEEMKTPRLVGENLHFQPPSIFSPVITYDISFWLPEGVSEISREDFSNAIGSWKGNAVIRRIEFLERYEKHPDDIISECYRVQYQRVDSGLHPDNVKEYQVDLLNHLKEKINIKTRS